MRTYLLLSFCAIVLLLSACSDTTNNPQPIEETPKQNYIVPLAVGNQWKYKKTSFYKGVTEEIYDMTVHSEETINGIKEYGILQSSHDKVYMHWYNSTQGFWHYYIVFDDKFFMAKYPCRTNDEWVMDTFIRTDEQGNSLGKGEERITVISTNTQRMVNGKNYTCYHYRRTMHDANTGKVIIPTVYDYYYAVNIGLVEEIHSYNDITNHKIELLSHTVK